VRQLHSIRSFITTNLYQNLYVQGHWTWQHKISIPFTWRKIIPNSANQNGIGRFPDFSSPLAEWKVWLARLIAVSITLSLFGSFVWCFYLAMLFGSFIRCFHLAICASTPVTLIFITTLSVTSLDSRPKRRQSRPTSGSQGHIGVSKNFRGGPNTSVEFGPGVQLLRGSKYYVTGFLGAGGQACTLASSTCLIPRTKNVYRAAYEAVSQVYM